MKSLLSSYTQVVVAAFDLACRGIQIAHVDILVKFAMQLTFHSEEIKLSTKPFLWASR